MSWDRSRTDGTSMNVCLQPVIRSLTQQCGSTVQPNLQDMQQAALNDGPDISGITAVASEYCECFNGYSVFVRDRGRMSAMYARDGIADVPALAAPRCADRAFMRTFN